MAELGVELATLIIRQRNERVAAAPREVRAIVELASAMVEIGGESARAAFARSLRSTVSGNVPWPELHAKSRPLTRE